MVRTVARRATTAGRGKAGKLRGGVGRHLQAQRPVRDLEHGAGGEEQQQRAEQEGQLQRRDGGAAGHVVTQEVCARHPPDRDEAERRREAAEQDERTPPAPARAGVVREMPDDGIGERLPQARQDQDRPQPHGADAERDVAQERHQLQHGVEQRDRDQAAQPERDQLLPRHPILGRRGVPCLRRHGAARCSTGALASMAIRRAGEACCPAPPESG